MKETTILMPKGNYCQIVSMFSESFTCPDLDTEVTLRPLCVKYDKHLSWNTAGSIHKCSECLKEDKNGTMEAKRRRN